ncbi:MAG: TonB family protein, partial [Candidatus Sulfotelmatobacter sp.]
VVLPILVLAAVVFAIFIGSKFVGHKSSLPAPQAQPENSQPQNSRPGNLSTKPSAAPTPKNSPHAGLVPGSEMNQVMPEVSRNALHTIKGRIKVGVEVAVDASGNVSSARLRSAGPSKYFSSRALGAARQWKFEPAQVNGKPVPSEWLLRFQFARTSTQVFPIELKP